MKVRANAQLQNIVTTISYGFLPAKNKSPHVMLVKVCTSASGSLESRGTGLEAMESSLPILGAGLPQVWGVKASSQQQREARDAELLKASEK